MSAQQLLLPFRPVINLRGGLEAGATLEVYESEGLTPYPIYANEALTEELPNPLEANGFGVFPPIYFNANQQIRLIIKESNGNVLYDVDPYLDASTAEEFAEIAGAAAQIALAASGPLYLTTAAGLAVTPDGDEFNVDNGDGTATIYVNNSGVAVKRRTIIIAPSASGTAGILGYGDASVADSLPQTLPFYGAVGDGTTDDTAAVTAADAASGKKYAPAGTYDTTLAATDLDGPYWGEGQIRDVANNNRAPWFSAVKAAPSPLGNHDSIETAFNGDLSRVQIAMEHRITGANTLGQPTSGYLYRPEAMPFYGYLYNASGWNNATNGNDGRTGVAFQRVRVFQAGQGDAVAYNASAFVTGTKSGSTSFLANPAAVLFNGDIQGGQSGVYLNAGELIMRDGGFDVAAVGWVVNGVRTVSTGAKDAYWAGFRAQSQGSAAMDQAFGMAGLFKVGVDATPADFGANKAFAALKAGDRIYFNASSSNGFYATSLSDTFIEYASGISGFSFAVGGTSRFQINASQVTVNGVKLNTNGKVGLDGTLALNFADDAAAAAGGVAVGEVYRNGSILRIRVV